MTCRPTSVRPGEHDLAHRPGGRRTAGRPPSPCPAAPVNTPSGSPASSASSPSRIAVSGVSSAGLSTTVLPGRERRGEPPAGDRHREVPRHDHADDAERLLEGDVDAAGHRDLPAEQPLRRGRVVAEHVADVARLPAGVADRVPGVGHLELGQLLAVRRRPLGEPPQQAARSAGRDRAPAGLAPTWARRWPRRSPPGQDLGDVGDDLLGGRVETVRACCRSLSTRRAHSRSKPR